jgi:hypothetical protein
MCQVIGLQARSDAILTNAHILVMIAWLVLYLEIQIAVTPKNTDRPGLFYFND